MGELRDRRSIRIENIPLYSQLNGRLFDEWYAVLRLELEGKDVPLLMSWPYRMSFMLFIDRRLNHLCNGVLNQSSYEVLEPEVAVLTEKQRFVFNTAVIDMLKYSSSRSVDIEEKDLPSVTNDSLEVLNRFLELQSQPEGTPIGQGEKHLNLYH